MSFSNLLGHPKGRIGSNPQAVIARYGNSSGGSVASGGGGLTLDFDTKFIDTHDAGVTGAGFFRFYAPIEGYYQVNLSMAMSAGSFTAGNLITLQILKNGVLYSQTYMVIQNTATQTPVINLSDAFDLEKDDTLEFVVTQNSGSSQNVSGDTTSTNVSISRIGSMAT